MLKRFLGVIAGVILGMIVVGLVEALGHVVYPVPEGLDIQDKEALVAYIGKLPPGAFLFILLAWAAGSFLGGGAAAWVTKERKNAVVVGVFLMLAGIMNMFAIPHPVWFRIISLWMFVPFAYLAARVVIRA